MMGVRCGRCGTEFNVDGPGRFPCPRCQAVNEVRPAPAAEPSLAVPPPTPKPAKPSPRAICQECSFGFIVGDIDVASCPNCGADVKIGAKP